jgi:hypothetical protein
MGENTSVPGRSRWRQRLGTAIRRTDLVTATAVAVSVATLSIALLTPGTLPLDASTGLVVGILAWIAGMTLAAFAGDRRGAREGERGDRGTEPVPQHPPHDVRVKAPQRSRARYLRTAGGARRHGADRSLRLQGDRREGARELATLLEGRGDTELLKIGVAPMDHHLAGAGWGEDIAEQFAREGNRVLLVDLRQAAASAPGVTDVARGQVGLGEAVTYHDTLKLARLGPGSDRRSAAVELGAVLATPPINVETVVVCLPPLGAAAVPAVAQVVDHLAFIAVRDRTLLDSVRRAVDVAGTDVEVTVALVDAGAGSASDPAAPHATPEPEPVWPASGHAPTAAGPCDLPPTRSEVWGREIAHASEELDATLDPDAIDIDAVWADEREGTPAGGGPTTVAEEPGADRLDAGEVWGVDGHDPSRSMSPSAHPRDPHG